MTTNYALDLGTTLEALQVAAQENDQRTTYLVEGIHADHFQGLTYSGYLISDTALTDLGGILGLPKFKDWWQTLQKGSTTAWPLRKGSTTAWTYFHDTVKVLIRSLTAEASDRTVVRWNGYGGKQVLAFLSPSYTPIQVAPQIEWFLEQLKLQGMHDWIVGKVESKPGYFYCIVREPKPSRAGGYYRAFELQTDNLGHGALKLRLCLYRLTCGNGAAVNVKDLSMRLIHHGQSAQKLPTDWTSFFQIVDLAMNTVVTFDHNWWQDDVEPLRVRPGRKVWEEALKTLATDVGGTWTGIADERRHQLSRFLAHDPELEKLGDEPPYVNLTLMDLVQVFSFLGERDYADRILTQGDL